MCIRHSHPSRWRVSFRMGGGFRLESLAVLNNYQWWVSLEYALVHEPSHKLKLGISGDWTRRAFGFSHDASLDGFDLDRSVGIYFGSDKKTALAAETMAKDFFHNANTTPPDCVPFGAYGHTEWFNAEIYADAVAEIAAFNTPCKRCSMTLREALASDLRGDGMALDGERIPGCGKSLKID